MCKRWLDYSCRGGPRNRLTSGLRKASVPRVESGAASTPTQHMLLRSCIVRDLQPNDVSTSRAVSDATALPARKVTDSLTSSQIRISVQVRDIRHQQPAAKKPRAAMAGRYPVSPLFPDVPKVDQCQNSFKAPRTKVPHSANSPRCQWLAKTAQAPVPESPSNAHNEIHTCGYQKGCLDESQLTIDTHRSCQMRILWRRTAISKAVGTRYAAAAQVMRP